MKKNKMIICRNCKKKVSAKAKRCKYCGTVLKMSRSALIITISIIAFVLAMFVIGFLQSR